MSKILYILWVIANTVLYYLSGNLTHSLKLLLKMPFIKFGELIRGSDVIFIIESTDLSSYDITEYLVLLILPYIIRRIFR